MSKYNNSLIIKIILLLGVTFILGCDKLENKEFGFREGVIKIGPLCPVEKDPPDPGCMPTIETYAAYSVSIWNLSESERITQINPSLDGSYKTELSPGRYKVILETGHIRIGGSNLPQEVKIESQSTSILNINIDTGIR